MAVGEQTGNAIVRMGLEEAEGSTEVRGEGVVVVVGLEDVEFFGGDNPSSTTGKGAVVVMVVVFSIIVIGI